MLYSDDRIVEGQWAAQGSQHIGEQPTLTHAVEVWSTRCWTTSIRGGCALIVIPATLSVGFNMSAVTGNQHEHWATIFEASMVSACEPSPSLESLRSERSVVDGDRADGRDRAPRGRVS